MDKGNYANVIALSKTKEEEEKVKLLLEVAELGVGEVPDPYYGGRDGFEYVYQLIDRACDQIVKDLGNGGK